jgi:hypothetical protein
LGHRWSGFGPSGEYFILIFGGLNIGRGYENFVFLRKMWSIHLHILPFTVHTIILSSPLCVILLHFSRFRSNRSFPPLSRTHSKTFKLFLIYVPKCCFHHHTKLGSKCGIWLVSSLSLHQFFWWKMSSSFTSWILLHPYTSTKSSLKNKPCKCKYQKMATLLNLHIMQVDPDSWLLHNDGR